MIKLFSKPHYQTPSGGVQGSSRAWKSRRKYDGTRHNVGFRARPPSAGARRNVNRSRFQSLLGEGVIAGQRVLLFKAADLHEPQRRGNARGALLVQTPGRTAHRPARRYQPAPGRIRVRAKGSDGGHNGLKSIIYQHGSDAFPRKNRRRHAAAPGLRHARLGARHLLTRPTDAP